MECLNKSLYWFYEERSITVGLLLCQCRDTEKSKLECPKHFSFRNNQGFQGGQNQGQLSTGYSTLLCFSREAQCHIHYLFYSFSTGKHLLQLSKGNCLDPPSQTALTTPVPPPSHQTNLQNNIVVCQEPIHHPWPCSCVAFLIKVVSSQSSPVIYVSLLELELH